MSVKVIHEEITRAYENAAAMPEFIGERRTPRKSNWPMRDKWKKYGKWWSCISRDGDAQFVNRVGIQFPMVIQLFYVVLDDGTVDQLCWTRPDLLERWEATGQEPPMDIVGEHTTIEMKSNSDE